MSKSKKPKKPTPSHLLSQLVHIRAELDDLIRAAEQQAGYSVKHDADWKARCKIVQRGNGHWDITSFDDKWWWSDRLDVWLPTWGEAVEIGIYKTAASARRVFSACTVPPPGECGR